MSVCVCLCVWQTVFQSKFCCPVDRVSSPYQVYTFSPLAPSLPSGRLLITFSPHIDLPGRPISILLLLLGGLLEEEEATNRLFAQWQHKSECETL